MLPCHKFYSLFWIVVGMKFFMPRGIFEPFLLSLCSQFNSAGDFISREKKISFKKLNFSQAGFTASSNINSRSLDNWSAVMKIIFYIGYRYAVHFYLKTFNDHNLLSILNCRHLQTFFIVAHLLLLLYPRVKVIIFKTPRIEGHLPIKNL